MASIAEKLRARLEDEFGIIIPKPIERIYGVRGSAFRWTCKDKKGHEYISEDTMADCLKAPRLTRILNPAAIGVVYTVGPN